MIIYPTPGRVVWFFNASGINGFTQPDAGQPCAAIVTRVWGDRMVNLVVFDADGKSYPFTLVELLQEGDSVPEYGSYATWMPYQVGQAKKHADALVAGDAPKGA